MATDRQSRKDDLAARKQQKREEKALHGDPNSLSQRFKRQLPESWTVKHTNGNVMKVNVPGRPLAHVIAFLLLGPVGNAIVLAFGTMRATKKARKEAEREPVAPYQQPRAQEPEPAANRGPQAQEHTPTPSRETAHEVLSPDPEPLTPTGPAPTDGPETVTQSETPGGVRPSATPMPAENAPSTTLVTTPPTVEGNPPAPEPTRAPEPTAAVAAASKAAKTTRTPRRSTTKTGTRNAAAKAAEAKFREAALKALLPLVDGTVTELDDGVCTLVIGPKTSEKAIAAATSTKALTAEAWEQMPDRIKAQVADSLAKKDSWARPMVEASLAKVDGPRILGEILAEHGIEMRTTSVVSMHRSAPERTLADAKGL